MRLLACLVFASFPAVSIAQDSLPVLQKAQTGPVATGLSDAALGLPADPAAVKSGELAAGLMADGRPSDFDSDKIAGMPGPDILPLVERAKAASVLPDPPPATNDLGSGPDGAKTADLSASHALGRETSYDNDKIDGNAEVFPPLAERAKLPGSYVTGTTEAALGIPVNPPDPKTGDLAVLHADAVTSLYDDDKISSNGPFVEETFSGPLSERQKYPGTLAEGTDPAEFGQPATDPVKVELAVSKEMLGQPNVEDNDKIVGNPFVPPPMLPRAKLASVLPDPVVDADLGQPLTEQPKTDFAVSKAMLEKPTLEDNDKIIGNPYVAPPMAERMKAPSYDAPVFGLSDDDLGLPLLPDAAKTADLTVGKGMESVTTLYDEDKIAGNEAPIDDFSDDYSYGPPDELIASVRAVLDDPLTRTATLNAIDARGFAPQALQPAFGNFVAALYDLPDVRDLVAPEIAQVLFDFGFANAESAQVARMAAEYLAVFGDDKARLGFARLETAEHRPFLAQTLQIAEGLPPDQCGLYLSGLMGAPQARKVWLDGIASLPAAEQSAALERQLAAILAEVQNTPVATVADSTEDDRARRMLGAAVLPAIDAMADADRLLGAYGDPVTALPADLCTVQSLILRTALATTGADGDLMLRYLVTNGWSL